MFHAHNAFIEQFGNPKEFRAALDNLSAMQLWQWRRRGIPWGWRHEVAGLANERGIPLPEGFLSRRRIGEAAGERPGAA